MIWSTRNQPTVVVDITRIQFQSNWGSSAERNFTAGIGNRPYLLGKQKTCLDCQRKSLLFLWLKIILRKKGPRRFFILSWNSNRLQLFKFLPSTVHPNVVERNVLGQCVFLFFCRKREKMLEKKQTSFKWKVKMAATDSDESSRDEFLFKFKTTQQEFGEKQWKYVEVTFYGRQSFSYVHHHLGANLYPNLFG